VTAVDRQNRAEHVLLQRLGACIRRSGAAAHAVVALADVGAEAPTVVIGAQQVPAAGAAHEPSEEPCFTGPSRARPRDATSALHETERRLGRERQMVLRSARELLAADDASRRALAFVAVHDRLTHVRRIPQQLAHYRGSAGTAVPLGEPARQVGERLAVATTLEQLGDHRTADRIAGERADHRGRNLMRRKAHAAGADDKPVDFTDPLQLRRQLHVARRWSREPDTALPRPGPRDRPLVPRVLALILRQRLQLREEHPPGRRLEVHVALGREQPTDAA
jgi:hypothetical protein